MNFYVNFVANLNKLEIHSNEKLGLRSVLCSEREREPLHTLLVVMHVTVLNSNALYPIVVEEEGSTSRSLLGTMKRSYKGTHVGGNLDCILR